MVELPWVGSGVGCGGPSGVLGVAAFVGDPRVHRFGLDAHTRRAGGKGRVVVGADDAALRVGHLLQLRGDGRERADAAPIEQEAERVARVAIAQEAEKGG